MGNIPEEVLLALAAKNSGGGSGGTSNYEDLENKPKINGETLSGNKSASDLGLATDDDVQGILDGQSIDSFSGVESALADKVDKVEGKGLSTNDYTDADKAIVGGVTAALASKQDALTAGDHITIDDGEIAVNRYAIPAGDIVYKVLTGDYNSGNTVYVDKYESNGTFIERVTASPSGYQSQDVDGFIRIYKEWNRWEITLLEDCKEQSAGYNYSVAPHNAVTENDFTFTVEQQLDNNDLVIRGELATKQDATDNNLQTTDKTIVGAINEVKTGLSGKQDTLTFDDTPTDNSNNPVKSNGVYDALALKQDKTDNTLQTTDKTVVGAVNELKSGLTNLDNEVNGDATTYPYADVITIEDAVPANVADCKVKIEPVQDLHGQSAPWVGGAGKNKLPLVLADIKSGNTDGTWTGNVYTINGGTITVNTRDDDTITGIDVSGTFTATTYLSLTNFTFTNGTNYVLNGAPNGSSFGTYFLSATIGADYGSGVNIAGDGSSNNVRIVIQSGTISTPVTFQPMIRLATETDATFAPYTNICPITGHTEASVQRDGANQWDEDWEQGGINDTDGSKTSASNQIRSKNYIPCMANTDYYVSAPANTISTYIYYYASDYSFIGRAGQTGAYNVSEKTITTPVNCAYMMMKAGTLTSYGNNISINYPSSITTYEPYAGKTYTIALGDTIYGGKVNPNTGVMTVTHKYVDLSTLSFTLASGNRWSTQTIADAKTVPDTQAANAYCSTLSIQSKNAITNNESLIGIAVNNQAMFVARNGSDTDTPTGDFVYELATPTTIQLTPQQIQLLKGTNTLTASTGQISVTVNGVNGAIGAVQEQVNEIETRLATVESKALYVGKGQHNLTNTVFCGYITGSGNYINFFVPCKYDSTISSVTLDSDAVFTIYTYDGLSILQSGIDFTYGSCVKTEHGLRIELKFTETQTTYKSTIANISFGNDSVFTFA